LNGECLQRIRGKLLSQGALKADLIVPGKKMKSGVGFTKIQPPLSWNTWYEKVKHIEG